MPGSEAVKLYQQAESLKAQGRFEEAAAGYRSALDSDPHSLELWWGLGDLYAQMENFPGVESCCREIISRNPSIPEVYLYLGMALQRQAKLKEAEAALRTSARLNPGLLDACYQLGIVQQSLGETAAAIDSYQKALTATRDRAPVLYNLSLLFQKQGRIDDAFSHAFDALQGSPASLKYRHNFVKLLHAFCPHQVSGAILTEILRCFDTRGLDAASLMKPCMLLLAQDPHVQQLVRLAEQGPNELLKMEVAKGAFDRVFNNELMQKLLLHTKIASPEFELVLCALRHMALDDAMGRAAEAPTGIFGADGKFIEALACQFFNTEYAAFVTEEETAAVRVLSDQLGQEIIDYQTSGKGFFERLAIRCMYRPLSSLDGIERMFEDGSNRLHTALPVIARRQWSDGQEEQSLLNGIEILTPIRTGVSAAVREQYEESPYPRWLSVDLYEPVSYRESLHTLLPHFAVPDFGTGPIRILVAGCGTGQHPIMLAAHFANSEVLAVDLSKTSLAYAKRKVGEFGLTNIRFAQADILELGSLGRRFHIVESVGVLHHMQDPQAGLEILTDLLVDEGLLRLGLYSAHGRQAVAAARQYIAEQEFDATANGIRAARRALLALDVNHPAYPATRFRDFYTLSECRDLLFHVQEHRLLLPELSKLLDNCGLRFIGFTHTDLQMVAGRYRERYPDNHDMTDLSKWHEFEQSHPDTFEEMYQFWCQKV